ncbi:MAG: SDR family oxidoreductase [Chitinivibrionales bacterium]|nr:SDR family oxidoreductase [Chitinivibrionales bacterium]
MNSRGTLLITGGSKRLGFALTRQALSIGYNILVHYRSDNSEMVAWTDQHREFKDRIGYIRGDLLEMHQDLIPAALDQASDLVGLVNNASLFTEGNIDSLDHFTRTFEINALTPLRLSHAFHACVGSGFIINITDAHDDGASVNFMNYRMSKHFLKDLTEQCALCFAPAIRVNALAPGAMLPPPGKDEAHLQRRASSIPLNRVGDITALQQAFAFLTTNEYITGQTLYVDGGWHVVKGD